MLKQVLLFSTKKPVFRPHKQGFKTGFCINIHKHSFNASYKTALRKQYVNWAKSRFFFIYLYIGLFAPMQHLFNSERDIRHGSIDMSLCEERTTAPRPW